LSALLLKRFQKGGRLRSRLEEQPSPRGGGKKRHQSRGGRGKCVGGRKGKTRILGGEHRGRGQVIKTG